MGVGLLIVLAAVCASYYVYEGVARQPTVEVKSISYKVVDKISLFGIDVPTNITFPVSLEAYNPNIIAINLVSADYKVYGNGIQVGYGSIEGPVKIPAGERKTLETEVKTSAGSGIQAAIDAFKKGSLEVRIEGTAMIDVPFIGVRPFPFSQEKDLLKDG